MHQHCWAVRGHWGEAQPAEVGAAPHELQGNKRHEYMLQSCCGEPKADRTHESLVQCLKLDTWTKLSSTQQRWVSQEIGKGRDPPCSPLLGLVQGPLHTAPSRFTGKHRLKSLPLLSWLSISQDTASWSLEVNCLCPLAGPLSLPVTSRSSAVFSELLCAQPNVSLTFCVPNPSWGLLLYICTWVVSKSRPHRFPTQGKGFDRT